VRVLVDLHSGRLEHISMIDEDQIEFGSVTFAAGRGRKGHRGLLYEPGGVGLTVPLGA
jgi:hypothetical protein